MNNREQQKAHDYIKKILEETKWHFDCPDFDDCLDAQDIEADKEGGFLVKAYGTLKWAKGSGYVRKCLKEWLDKEVEEIRGNYKDDNGLDITLDTFTDEQLEHYYEYEDEWLMEGDSGGYWYNIYAIPYISCGLPSVLLAAWIDRNIDMYPDPTPHKLYLFSKGLMSAEELCAYDGAMSKVYFNSFPLYVLDEKEDDFLEEISSLLVNKLENM